MAEAAMSQTNNSVRRDFISDTSLNRVAKLTILIQKSPLISPEREEKCVNLLLIMMKKTLIRLGIICAAVIMAVSCSGGESDSRKLTVSIEPQRYLLERIAGDKWKVATLLSRGEDPENFDPSLASLKSLFDSQAYFQVGTIEFEESLADRFGNSLNIVDTGRGVTLLEGTHDNCPHHDHDHAEESGHHEHEHATDPHIWCSLDNLRLMASNMLEAMIAIDPADSATYRSNFRRLEATLDSCDRIIRRNLQPAKGASFMVWHPSLSYFAADYGLHQMPMGMDNKEMSVAAFRHNIDEARRQGAALLLVQPDFDAGRSKAVASQADVRSEMINTMVYDLPAELIRISEIIK